VAVKYTGAAYLIYLGLGALVAAIRGAEPAERPRVAALARTTAYRQGLISDLSNPKMAAFFTSLLPQFGTSFAAMAAFGLLFCALTWLWLALYATVLARLRHVLSRAAVRRAVEALTGAALVALGLRVATEPRR
jgi:threonine/homoserine/homoserine lactone efflux protein